MIDTLKNLLVALFVLVIIFGSWFTDLDTEALGFILFVLSMLFLWGKWPGQMYIFCFFLAGLTMLFQGGVGITFGLICLAIGICFLFVALGKEPLFLQKLHSETLSSSSVYLDKKDERMKFLWLFLLLIVGSIILAAMRAFNLNGFIPIAIVFTPFIFLANKIWNIKKKEPEDSQAPIDFTLVNKMLLIGCAGLILALYLTKNQQLSQQVTPPLQVEKIVVGPETGLSHGINAAGKVEPSASAGLFDDLIPTTPKRGLEAAIGGPAKNIDVLQQSNQPTITDQTTKDIAASQQNVRINPASADAWYNLGVAYGNAKHYGKAIEAFQQALQINPDFANAWFNLGYIYGVIKQYANAIVAYQQAVRIKPDDAEAWYNLGLAYKSNGQAGMIFEVYDRLKTLDPDKADEIFTRMLSRSDS